MRSCFQWRFYSFLLRSREASVLFNKNICVFFFSEIFRKVLISTIVSWAEETQIETPKLVREMFRYKSFTFSTCRTIFTGILVHHKSYWTIFILILFRFIV